MHHFTRSKNGGCLAALITAVITILIIMILLGLESLSFFFIWEFQNYFVYSQP